MTVQELKAMCESYGAKIDKHPTHGFGDVEIGTGHPDLAAIRQAIMHRAPWAMLSIRTVNVLGHPQYGQRYLEFASYFWDESSAA